jgi:uncharacterized protein (UPF0548 family)
MFSFRRPTDDQVREYLARQQDDPWPYHFVGATRDLRGREPFSVSDDSPGAADGPKKAPDPFARWNIDHQRVLLGHGEEAFLVAKRAISAWQMFPQEMATLFWPTTLQTPGNTVAVQFWAAPLRMWLLLPARVVYAIDEPDRFGFAYGTLPDHVERGEERFLVERQLADDSVWYDLSVISRPGHWLAWLGYPYVRWQQARFRRLSAMAMQRAVREVEQ